MASCSFCAFACVVCQLGEGIVIYLLCGQSSDSCHCNYDSRHSACNVPYHSNAANIPGKSPCWVLWELLLRKEKKKSSAAARKKEKLVVGLLSQLLVTIKSPRVDRSRKYIFRNFLWFYVKYMVLLKIKSMLMVDCPDITGIITPTPKDRTRQRKKSKIMKTPSLLHNSSMSRTLFA